MSAALAELVGRLGRDDAGARRVAILDLIRLAGSEAGATAALLERLPRERDERAGVLIVRHLGNVGGPEALPALWGLHQDRATPVLLAHAAILAHDTIQGRVPLSASVRPAHASDENGG